MRKIFLFMMVSLDGYFEGPNHELDWHNVDAEFDDFAARQLDEADTIIFGRKTYELMASFWPTDAGKQADPVVAKKVNTMSKVVASRTLMCVDWENTRLVKDDIAEEFRKLQTQPGKDIIVLGSSNLCVSLIERGLLNELRIMINPVAIGAGHTLFSGLNQPLALELTASKTFRSGNVLLTYRPSN